jgi:hypothetical protein
VHEPSEIPFCRSDILQDFAVYLGRHLSKTDHGWRSLNIEADICEHHGELLERLCVWITTYDFNAVRFCLWEDKSVWVCVGLFPKKPDSFEISFYPDFALLDSGRLVEALVETVSVSTRLNYDESPEPLLRQIWNFDGEMNVEGVI